MGSNLQSNDMTTEMKESLLKMFGKLKETVVWKFEGELENVPKNVHLLKWAPQQSILAHSNLKFFITHGGQLSTTEAIHFGVPVIGLPMLGDQYVNMRAVQNKGFGIMVQLREELADDLNMAIDKMLKDPTYTTTAKHLSSIYHDRPVSPGTEIVHWTEHVVKTGGAPHLRSSALLVPWYQKLYLDYFALIIVAVLVVIKATKV
ncbi:UDP-glucosyltransferase, partial [Operophtera brumata]